MRNAFASEITKLAAEDERLVLLSGDIGNKLFDEFKQKFPKRFYNCGVAEANMMSVAAGMALSGMRPIVYTIASFTTARCFEQIRVDVCYQNLPVVIAGVGAGLSYVANGATHHSCEDIATLRALPNMTVVCPGDPVEVRAGLAAVLQHPGPVYFRLGKKGEPVVHQRLSEFVVGRGIIVREGHDVCLVSTGNMLAEAVEAGEELKKHGLTARVVSHHTVKPLDEELLAESFERFRAVVTIEEHSVLGGLGGSVAEWLSDQPPQRARLVRIGTPDSFFCEAGEQEYARERLGLTAHHIAKRVLETCHSTHFRGVRLAA
jgi:transketolase